MSLLKLIVDGRIHPTRIEEVVTKSRAEVEQQLREEGKKAPTRQGAQAAELIRTVGRLKFRYSYGQDQLTHSLEVSFLAAAMASEMGADVNICRRAGFLHDVGKAVDHEVDGGARHHWRRAGQGSSASPLGWCTPSKPTTSRSRRRP